MKKLLYVVFVALNAIACEKEIQNPSEVNNPSTDSIADSSYTKVNPLLNSNWELSHVKYSDNDSIVYFPKDSSHKISISIADTTIQFTGICNSRVGIYHYYPNNDSVYVKHMRPSETVCDLYYFKWDEMVCNGFEHLNDYKLDTAELIILTDLNYTIYFKKK